MASTIRELFLGHTSSQASAKRRQLFLDKHHLSARRKTRFGQKTPEDSQQVASAFGVAVREAIIEHNTAAVHSADQTAMNYERLPSHTISEKRERTV